MAKADTQFKKGVSGNPRGKPKGCKQPTKEFKVSNQKELAEKIISYFKMTIPECNEIFKNDLTPMLDRIILKVMAQSFQKGDHLKLNFLLDRAIGKVKEEQQIDLTNNTTIDKSDIKKLSNEQLEILSKISNKTE